MKEPYTADELGRLVYVYSEEPAEAAWDGKQYELGGEGVKVKYGVAIHWQNTLNCLRIEDIPTTEPAEREIVNPLEANDRGAAFSGLKRPGRRKASGE